MQQQKKQKTNKIYNKLKVSNVSMEFTSHKDLATVIKNKTFLNEKNKNKK